MRDSQRKNQKTSSDMRGVPLRLRRTLRRMSRYREILSALLHHGFGDVVRAIDSVSYRRMLGSLVPPQHREPRPERLRALLEELGPTFVKIGQLLSHRSDLIPASWLVELEKLRGAVPPASTQAIRQVIEQDLGQPLAQIFAQFDEVPMASASVAQVHRACLLGKNGEPGDVVAVKVQRPGIRPVMESDLAILMSLARIAVRRIPSLAPFRPVEAVKELERAVLTELDFQNEAGNMVLFRKNFSGNQNVTAPRPYLELCQNRVLVMEYWEGVPVGQWTGDAPQASLLARQGAEAVLKQVFEDRFFHADPHGGNILVTPEGLLVFLDFGQTGTLLPGQGRFLAGILTDLLRRDSKRAVRAIVNWSGYPSPETERLMLDDMERLIALAVPSSSGVVDVGEMVGGMFSMIRRYGISVPSNFYLLAKCLATIEDIALHLDSRFDFVNSSRPFVTNLLRREFQDGAWASEAAGMGEDAYFLLRDVPGDLRDILGRLRDGRLRMELGHTGLEGLRQSLSRASVRISAAVLLASMIMGSSLLVHSLIPPLVFGVPVIGVLGFVVSGIMGTVFLVDLWRHR